MKKNLLFPFFLFLSLFVNAQTWAPVYTDGFEPADGFLMGFSCSKQTVFYGTAEPINQVPALSNVLWKQIYSDNTYPNATNPTRKTFRAEILAGSRTGGVGTQVLKITIPDSCYNKGTGVDAKLRLQAHPTNQITSGTNVLTAERITVWAKVDGASSAMILGLHGSPITITNTWAKYEGLFKNATGSTALNPSIDFVRTGLDQVIYFDDYVYEKITTDVKDVFEGDLSVYYADGNIYFSAPASLRQVQLFDLAGRKVIDLSLSENFISVEGLSSGVYVVNAFSDSKQYKTKLVIK